MHLGHGYHPLPGSHCRAGIPTKLPPMRNSFLPIVGVVLLTVACFWLIPDGLGDGAEGPQVQAGILRLPKDRKLLVASAAIPVEQEVLTRTVGAPPPGLEQEGWRVVAIALDDTVPLTRAVALALGERLTELGAVAVFDVPDAALLPTPPDRVLRVRSEDGGRPAADGSLSGIVSIHQHEVRLPARHPAAGLMEASSVQERSWRIKHQSTPSAGVAWPHRWAAIGRALADTVLKDLGVLDRLPQEWDRMRPVVPAGKAIPYAWHQPGRLWLLFAVPVFLIVRILASRRLPADHRSRTGWRSWRPWIIATALTVMIVISSGPYRVGPTARDVPLSSWSVHLPLPPNLEVLRWNGCFEHDLVRGWVGRIQGKTTADRMGRPISALEPLQRLLSKKQADDGAAREAEDGLWREEIAPFPDALLFGRNRGGVDEFILVLPDDEGWDCVLWQEQGRANTVQASWLDAVDEPELVRVARRKLRRHLLTPRIPADQHDEAVELLREDPDVTEVAMLAELPTATAGEKIHAATARWVLGRSDRPTAGERTWAVLSAGETVAVDGRPLLFAVGDAVGLVLLGPDGRGELVLRDATGVSSAPIADAQGASITRPDGITVSIVRQTEGWQLSIR